MTKMTIQDLMTPEAVKREKNENVLARWWNLLNDWTWPDDLLGKPEEWDDLPRWHPVGSPEHGEKPCRSDWIEPIVKHIEFVIGLKECLRYHHLNNLDRTNDAFELWWKNRERSER